MSGEEKNFPLFKEPKGIEGLENLSDGQDASEGNSKIGTLFPTIKVREVYENRSKEKVSVDSFAINSRAFPEESLPSKFKDAEGVSILKRKIINKEVFTEDYAKLRLPLKAERKPERAERQDIQLPSRAYEIELGSLSREVRTLERTESTLPVIREAVFREEGKVKRAFVKVENINIEVKLIRDRVEIQFSVPSGKESMLGFMDYLKISQILNSVGLRVEGFSVNGQEVNRPRLRLKEKDNINLDELAQKGRDYLNGSPSFSVAL